METSNAGAKRIRADRSYIGPVFLSFLLLTDYVLALAFKHDWFCYQTTALWIAFTTVTSFVTMIIMYFTNIIVDQESDAPASLFGIFLTLFYATSFYAIQYFIIFKMMGPDHFAISNNSPVDGFDFFYFSVTTIATVGYGDIAPLSNLSRFIAIAEIITGITFLIFFVSAYREITSSMIELNKQDDEYYRKLEDEYRNFKKDHDNSTGEISKKDSSGDIQKDL